MVNTIEQSCHGTALIEHERDSRGVVASYVVGWARHGRGTSADGHRVLVGGLAQQYWCRRSLALGNCEVFAPV